VNWPVLLSGGGRVALVRRLPHLGQGIRGEDVARAPEGDAYLRLGSEGAAFDRDSFSLDELYDYAMADADLVQVAERALADAEEAYRLDPSDANQRRVMSAWSFVGRARQSADAEDRSAKAAPDE
jgi:hypothetical protein